MIADHMGHNLNIHTDVYRMQSSVLEKTKVAKVLLAFETGQLSKFRGRKLDEIPEEGINAFAVFIIALKWRNQCLFQGIAYLHVVPFMDSSSYKIMHTSLEQYSFVKTFPIVDV